MNPHIAQCLLFGVALAAFAQAEPPPPMDFPAHEARPLPPGPGAPPPIERFFEVVRQRDPEDYERLRRLRETDPAAFRAEIAERIRRERDRRGLPEFPEGAPSPRGAGPRGEREHRGPGAGREDGDVMRVHSPELETLERHARELARALREADTDEERRGIEADLRAALARAFDLREQLRRERVQQMRERLEKVEKLLAERAAHRDAIIERRLRQLSSDPAMEW